MYTLRIVKLFVNLNFNTTKKIGDGVNLLLTNTTLLK